VATKTRRAAASTIRRCGHASNRKAASLKRRVTANSPARTTTRGATGTKVSCKPNTNTTRAASGGKPQKAGKAVKPQKPAK